MTNMLKGLTERKDVMTEGTGTSQEMGTMRKIRMETLQTMIMTSEVKNSFGWLTHRIDTAEGSLQELEDRILSNVKRRRREKTESLTMSGRIKQPGREGRGGVPE